MTKEKRIVRTIPPLPNYKQGKSQNGIKVAILISDHFHDAQAIYPYYRLMEEGYEVVYAGQSLQEYVGKWGYKIQTTQKTALLRADDLTAIIIPGGFGAENQRIDPIILGLIREMDRRGKIVGAMSHGCWVIASANIIKNRRATCNKFIKDDIENAGAEYIDRPVVIDNNLITSRNTADLPFFVKEIINKI